MDGFNFEKAFGRPVKIINDAAMQALGSYRGGRMLSPGLGTGLGSALVVTLKRAGEKKWIKNVFDVVEQLKNALPPENVVLGGGNSKRLKKLPPETICGDNEDARKGGLRLWNRSRRRTQR